MTNDTTTTQWESNTSGRDESFHRMLLVVTDAMIAEDQEGRDG